VKIGQLPILLGFIGALPLLAGCQSFANRVADRYGPAPVLDATAVSNAVDNQVAILASLARASGASMPALNPSSDWYFVMEGGFNYVDERCDQYLTDLFIANRERDKIKGLASVRP
jgi:hypothetical protein